MDIQYYGANCLGVGFKQTKLIIDDNLNKLGLNGVLKPSDVALFTSSEADRKAKARLIIDSPGEYEVDDVSIYGIGARSHIDEEGAHTATIYKIIANDLSVVVLGHIYPELNDNELEEIGMVDVLLVPVGGHGYTLDGQGALKLIRELAPKLVIPTHYDDKDIKYPVPQDTLEDALKSLSMEPKETVSKLKLKSTDLSDIMQLVVLERS